MNSQVSEGLLKDRLGPVQCIGNSIQWVLETSSTNVFLRDQALSGASQGSVILADSQTEGKGRQGRNWHSSPGLGLYFSIFLKPELPPENLHQLTLLAGVALVQALKPLIPSGPHLKWPNDVLVGKKKLAGILSETVSLKNETGIIVGIGINVNHQETDFPAALRPLATSISIETGKQWNRVDLAAKLLYQLDQVYATFLESGLAPMISAWEQNTRMLGEKITVTKGSQEYQATAIRLAPSGGLVIATVDGEESILDSGEVHLVSN